MMDDRLRAFFGKVCERAIQQRHQEFLSDDL